MPDPSSMFSKGGGGGSPKNVFIKGQDILTPGYNVGSRYSGGGVNTTFTRNNTAAQQEFDARLPRILTNIDTLRTGITPGFSDIRKARLESVRAAKEASLSNLGEQVAQRRLQGSSLETNLRLQTEKTFASEEANQMAQSYIEELQANSQLLTQEFSTVSAGIERELAELGVAAGVSTNFTQMASSGVQFAASLAASQAGAAGGALGGLLGLGVSAFGAQGPFGQGGAFGGGGTADTAGQTGLVGGSTAASQFTPAQAWAGW